jgi:hypothetical protein
LLCGSRRTGIALDALHEFESIEIELDLGPCAACPDLFELPVIDAVIVEIAWLERDWLQGRRDAFYS